MNRFRSLTIAQLRLLLLILAAIIVSVFPLAGIGTSTMLTNGLFRTHAQTALSGQWTASLSTRQGGQINVNFMRTSEKGGINMNGHSYPISDLQGLNVDIKLAAKASVSFRVVREAGTINCEGYFSAGQGAGI